MAPLPPVRKRRDYSAIRSDDLVMALFSDRVLGVGDMQAWAELSPAEAELAAMRAVDLEKWGRKAMRRVANLQPAGHFESEWLDPAEVERIALALEGAKSVDEVRAAFKASEPGEGLSVDERALWERLRRTMSAAQAESVARILAGDPTAVDLGAALAPDLLSALAAAAEKAAAAGLGELGVAGDEVRISTAASLWARSYGGQLIRGISDATRQVVGQAVGMFLETQGMTRAQLEARLAGAFSARRAETIAITEVTRAASQGMAIAQEQLAAAGLNYARVWQTNADDRTCPICGNLNGTRESSWADRFPDGPPGHPRCRCSLTLERVKK